MDEYMQARDEGICSVWRPRWHENILFLCHRVYTVGAEYILSPYMVSKLRVLLEPSITTCLPLDGR